MRLLKHIDESKWGTIIVSNILILTIAFTFWLNLPVPYMDAGILFNDAIYQAAYNEAYDVLTKGQNQTPDQPRIANPAMHVDDPGPKPGLREFESVEALRNWLQDNDGNDTRYLWVDSSGVDLYDVEYDCDDYALTLQKQASLDGYLVSVTVIDTPEGKHMLNLAVIDGCIYHIEPQTDEVWLLSSLD